MNISYEYKYNNINEIFSSLNDYSTFGVIEWSILSSIIILSFLFIFYLFPIISTITDKIKKNIEKKKKKLILKKISIQKNVEDEIEEFFKKEAEKNIEKRNQEEKII